MIKLNVMCVLTTNCNLNCSHCYFNTGARKKCINELNFNDFVSFLKRNKEHISKVTLTGGEPLLYSRFKDIICFFKKENIAFSLNTNLTLMDKEKLGLILSAPVKSISVSFDAPLDYKGDLLHKGHAAAVKNLKMLLKNKKNIPIRVVSILSRQNYLKAEEIYQSFKNLDIYDFSFQPVYVPKKYSEKYSLSSLPKKELKELFLKLKQWAKEQNYGQFLKFLENYYLKGKIMKFQCAALKTLYIEPDGKVYSCLNSSIVLGDFNSLKIADLINSRAFRKEKTKALNLSCFTDRCFCAIAPALKAKQ